MTSRFKILHCGCAQTPLLEELQNIGAKEIRLDINPVFKPDIVASVTSIPMDDASVNIVYASHLIEHLYVHEVEKAFSEFFRVLVRGGQCLLLCPDMEQICKAVMDGKMEDAVYHVDAGPITAAMMMFGYSPNIADGNLFMAHHYGFTAKSLEDRLRAVGFSKVKTFLDGYNLVAVADK